jgi:hypothetical protein
MTKLGIFFNFLINRYTDFEKPKEIQRNGRRGAGLGVRNSRTGKHRTEVTEGIGDGGWSTLNAERRQAICFFLKMMQVTAMNMTLGYALLRDRRVPIRTKLIALGIGAAGVGAIELLQLPLEGVFAALLPLVGAAGDLTLDGAEAVIGPILIATLVLPHLVPGDLVRQVRTEAQRMAHS